MSVLSFGDTDYPAPFFPVQIDPQATSLEPDQIPTGATLDSWAKSYTSDTFNVTSGSQTIAFTVYKFKDGKKFIIGSNLNFPAGGITAQGVIPAAYRPIFAVWLPGMNSQYSASGNNDRYRPFAVGTNGDLTIYNSPYGGFWGGGWYY